MAVESIDNCETTLKLKLVNWALKYKIKHNALSALLKILKEESHTELPDDSRTLLKTVCKSELKTNQDGSENCYFRLGKRLLQHDLKELCIGTTVQLKVNIDGLPICKSTGAQFCAKLYPVTMYLLF